MTIMDNFKSHEADSPPIKLNLPERIRGRIFMINEDGWGFISSKQIPFRRIYFHWTFLEGDTLKFEELDEGMIVDFKPVFIPAQGDIPEKGWRAIKLKIMVGENDE